MAEQTIGKRLQTVRKRAGFTQRELADLSGVSVSLIQQLEQEQRNDTRLETLRKLAAALRVPTTALIARPDADHADQGTVDAWEPVRDALMGKPGDRSDEAPTIAGVEAAVTAAVPLFASGRYAELGAALPPLLRDADALGSAGRDVRARLLHLTGWVLTQTRQFDAAEIALNRALDDATDRISAVAVVNHLCWLLIRQGKLNDTLSLATKWADDIEPRMSRATNEELAAWGWLLIRVATAAVRDSRPGDAADAIRMARMAAVGIGNGREYDMKSDLTHAFGPVTVSMKHAEILSISGRPDRVLTLAQTIPTKGATLASRNRHRLDVANAHVEMHNSAEAFDVLREIRSAAPEWIVNQRYARDIMGKIAEKRRTLTPEMREMADFIGLPY